MYKFHVQQYFLFWLNVHVAETLLAINDTHSRSIKGGVQTDKKEHWQNELKSLGIEPRLQMTSWRGLGLLVTINTKGSTKGREEKRE